MRSIKKYLTDNTASSSFRPLGDISNFVQDELPLLTNKLNEEKNSSARKIMINDLVEKINQLFADVNIQRIEEIELSNQFKIAVLDCKMCAMFLWHNQVEKLPINLANTLNTLGLITGDPIILTYEDIIINNPETDLRTFFDKNYNTGKNEAFFYRCHQVIEYWIMPTVSMIANSISLKSVSRFKILTIETHLKEANTINIDLREQLDKEAFIIFRKYLETVKTSNLTLQGPSGAFSGTYPLIDLMWRGKDIFEDNRSRYLNNNVYFPSFQRKEIQRLTTMPSLSVKILAEAGTSGFKDLYEVLYNELNSFRAAHLASVKKHLPAVFNNEKPGTAGDMEKGTGTYLKDSVKNNEEEEL